MNAIAPLSRRGFLAAIAATGAAMTFAVGPEAAAAAGDFEPTIWYSIGRDGIVTVNVIRAEMGQHVGTALARILAGDNKKGDVMVVDPSSSEFFNALRSTTPGTQRK